MNLQLRESSLHMRHTILVLGDLGGHVLKLDRDRLCVERLGLPLRRKVLVGPTLLQRLGY